MSTRPGEGVESNESWKLGEDVTHFENKRDEKKRGNSQESSRRELLKHFGQKHSEGLADDRCALALP